MDTVITPVVVPYSGAVPGGVHQGLEIEIQGSVPHHAHDGFSINLCQGPQTEPTTLLHFNPRQGQHEIVMNCMQNGHWGHEEKHKMHHHFQKGQPFDVRIMVKPQMFKIKVNGGHLADFAHRLPKETAQFLHIKGQVAINFIKYHPGGHGGAHRGGFPPQPQPAGFCPPPSGYPMGHVPAPQPSGPIFNPPVPFKAGIPGGLAPGRMINISGVPFPNPSRFNINLQSGMHDGADVLLQVDVRFRFSSDVNILVRNHCQNGQWGQEDRAISYFPFAPNANFDILILCEQQAFKIAVNNQHMTEFYHRLPYQNGNTLNIVGDVRLTQVRFQ